ncbi:MAG: hypothetical protein ABIO55_06840 [Ginsengibacter sp.]
MKKLAFFISILLVALVALVFRNEKTHNQTKIAPTTVESLDEDMVGPRGEEIFIGSGGGRYYLKDDRRIYVGYKGKKQHAS